MMTPWPIAATRAAILFAVATITHPGLAAAEDSSDGPRALEEIVVTAQKTEQSVQDVPISVSVVNGAFLRDAGVTQLAEAARYLPNVQIVNDPSVPAAYIRGFGTGTINEGFEPSVGLVVDDVSYGKAIYFADALFDVDRVEVLRGPQGTLFGKNTDAGLFNITTAEPTHELAGALRASLGTLSLKRFEGGVGGPLFDGLDFRASFLGWKQEGSVENTTLHRTEDALEQYAGRLKLRWAPSDVWQVDLAGFYASTETNFAGFQLKSLRDDSEAFLRRYDPAVEDDPFDQQTALDFPGIVDRNTDGASARVRRSLGDWALFRDLEATGIAATTGYRTTIDVDFDISPADITDIPWTQRYRQDSLELRLAGRLEPFFSTSGADFVAGVYLSRFGYVVDQFIFSGSDLDDYLLSADGQRAVLGAGVPLPLPDVPLDFRSLGDGVGVKLDEHARTAAFFMQSTLHVTDALGAITGIRVGREVKTGSIVGRTLGPGVLGQAIGFRDYDEDRRIDDDEVSPKLGLTYALGDDVTAFFTWSKGFKSGGFNATSFTNESLEFKAERATSFETGAKSRLLDHSLDVNLTFFRTSFRDLQVLVLNGAAFKGKNAADSTSWGMELDAAWLASWEPLSVAASLGYVRAKYDEFEDAPPLAFSGETSQDLSGETLANAPEWTASLSPNIRLPLPFLRGFKSEPLTLDLGMNASFQSRVFLDTTLAPETRQGSYAVLNGRIALGSGGWQLGLAVKNLTDTDALMWATASSFFTDGYFARQIPERQLAATFSYAF